MKREDPVLSLLKAGARLEQVRGALSRTPAEELASVVVRMIAFAAHVDRDLGAHDRARRIVELAGSTSERLRAFRRELLARPSTVIDRAQAAGARFDALIGRRRPQVRSVVTGSFKLSELYRPRRFV